MYRTMCGPSASLFCYHGIAGWPLMGQHTLLDGYMHHMIVLSDPSDFSVTQQHAQVTPSTWHIKFGKASCPKNGCLYTHRSKVVNISLPESNLGCLFVCSWYYSFIDIHEVFLKSLLGKTVGQTHTHTETEKNQDDNLTFPKYLWYFEQRASNRNDRHKMSCSKCLDKMKTAVTQSCSDNTIMNLIITLTVDQTSPSHRSFSVISRSHHGIIHHKWHTL